MILQSCAIKSQLQDHDGALVSGKEGLLNCIKVLKYSYELCYSEIVDRFENRKDSKGDSS